MERQAGILLAISSLPSPYGIGTLGEAAIKFIDFLSDAGQQIWQVLPIGPTSFGDSPYQSFSTFAGNPFFIDLDILKKDGLLTEGEINGYDWGNDNRHIDYGKIYENRFRVLEKAKDRGWEREKEEIDKFAAENRWLENYALFMACKRYFGMKSWTEWPDDEIRKRSQAAVEKYKEMLRQDVELFIFIQYCFFKQWGNIKEYAHEKGIQLIGDVPIYVAMDSADVWSEPEQFQLGEDSLPTKVAGCPPDAFSEGGQLWGNPLYNWEYMEEDGFGWWIRRIAGLTGLYDLIRIDHFRGLDEYWAVPYGDKTALNGKWEKGPGMKLINVLNSWFTGINYIAEDLGVLTPSVRELLKESGWPGMKVLEFAFESGGENEYLPHHYGRNCICYTGTHDNMPLAQWFEEAKPEEVANAVRYFNLTRREGYCRGMIRGGMGSPAGIFIAQMQDYLELGPESRMNLPSSPDGWWRWRLTEEEICGRQGAKLAEKISDMTSLYGRRKS